MKICCIYVKGWFVCVFSWAQIIRNSNLGVDFSDDELALLFCKYDRNGEFNYYRFCRDVEAAGRT